MANRNLRSLRFRLGRLFVKGCPPGWLVGCSLHPSIQCPFVWDLYFSCYFCKLKPKLNDLSFIGVKIEVVFFFI